MRLNINTIVEVSHIKVPSLVLTIVHYRAESPQQPQVVSLPLEAGLGSSLEVTQQQQSGLGERKQNSSPDGNRTRAT